LTQTDLHRNPSHDFEIANKVTTENKKEHGESTLRAGQKINEFLSIPACGSATRANCKPGYKSLT
jgi:hypothetical protein